jgi:hypothetical protein
MSFNIDTYIKYEQLASKLKTKEIKLKTNHQCHFDFYIEMMHKSKIDTTKCYDGRLFLNSYEAPQLSQELDVSVEKISIYYNKLSGYYISFKLEVHDIRETFTYNASERSMEMFLFNTIYNNAIIY